MTDVSCRLRIQTNIPETERIQTDVPGDGFNQTDVPETEVPDWMSPRHVLRYPLTDVPETEVPLTECLGVR